MTVARLLIAVILLLLAGGGIFGALSGLSVTQNVTISSRVTAIPTSSQATAISTTESDYTSSLPAGVITLMGTTLTNPVFKSWAKNFTEAFPSISVTDGSIFCGSEDCITPYPGTIFGSDGAASNQSLDGLLRIPLFVSAEAIIYNIPGMPETLHLNLTGTLLADIYDGTVITWDDPRIEALNPAAIQFLPDRPVITIHRIDGSGTTITFTQYLSEGDPAWAKQVGYGATVDWPALSSEQGASGDGGVLSNCNASAYSIGYVAITYVPKALSDGLGYANVQNPAGKFATISAGAIDTGIDSLVSSVSGTKARSSDANYYPLVNFEYADVLENQNSSSLGLAVKTFLQWAIDPNGGNSAYYLTPLNFLPLTPGALQLSQSQINEIGP
jgi:phosphate transport system substrate-binding protein